MNLQQISAAILAVCLVSGTANAALLYNESSFGDLAQGSGSPTFTNLAGNNEVSGTMALTQSVFDIDSFSFTLLPGQSVNNFTFSFSNSLLTRNESVSGNVFFYSGRFASNLAGLGNVSWLARAPGSIYGSSSQSPISFTPQSPLGPGTYSVSIAPNGRSIDGGFVPYSLSFNVVAVPEPETYAMFIAGLGLIGNISRRKKHKKA
jgi:hypothetical protein